MKFTLVPILLAFMLLPKLSLAQYSISLDGSNTFRYGNSYLIDIPLTLGIKKLFIKDFSNLIPVEIYKNAYVNGNFHVMQDENSFRLDTIFISKNILNNGHALNRFLINGNPVTDSLNKISKDLRSYKSVKKTVNPKKYIIIYYIERHGATGGAGVDDIALPAMKRDLENFIKKFEAANNVKIDGTFITGDGGGEGGVIYYFSLSGLTGEQKTKFIDERERLLRRQRLSYISDESKLREIEKNTNSIYIPQLVSVDVLHPSEIIQKMRKKLDANKIYSQVEVEPRSPDGNDAFNELFKDIHFYDGFIPRRVIITFVVEKNGALTNVKVIRGGTEQTEDEIKKVIKKSKRWIPGTQNNKPVRVQLTFPITPNTNNTPQ